MGDEDACARLGLKLPNLNQWQEVQIGSSTPTGNESEESGKRGWLCEFRGAEEEEMTSYESGRRESKGRPRYGPRQEQALTRAWLQEQPVRVRGHIGFSVSTSGKREDMDIYLVQDSRGRNDWTCSTFSWKVPSVVLWIWMGEAPPTVCGFPHLSILHQ